LFGKLLEDFSLTPEAEQKQKLFQFLLLSIMAIATVGLGSQYFALSGPGNESIQNRQLVQIVIANFSGIILLYLNQRGKTKLASLLLVSIYIAVIFGNSTFANGIRSIAFHHVGIAVMLSSLLLGWRAGFLTGTMILVLGVVFIILENFGILVYDYPKFAPIAYLVNLFVTVLFLGVIQFLSVSLLERSLRKTNEELERRISAEKEVERYQRTLEDLVEERTLQLEAAQGQLIQSEKMAAIGTLAMGIAHEINNPLNYISGGINAIKEAIEEDAPETAKNLEPMIAAIVQGVNRTSKIVSSLNHYSTSEGSEKQFADIHTIIENSLLLMHEAIKEKTKITRNYCSCSPKVLVNEVALQHVLINVILNGIDAMAEFGEMSITTTCKRDFTIIISDTGVGISPENLPRVFDPFFTTKEQGKGTGLGLSIAYSIIKDHQGSIEIQSTPGKGTTVSINLPIK